MIRQSFTYGRIIPSNNDAHKNMAWALWNRFGLHLLPWEKSPYTLKELATTTYFSRREPAHELCELEYYTDKDYWDRLIKDTVKYAQEIDDKCRITVITLWDKVRKEYVTKVCKSTRTHSVTRNKHKLKIAGGIVASAERENARLELDINIGNELMLAIDNKLPAFIQGDERKKLLVDLATGVRDQMQRDIGREEAAREFMAILNSNPDIKAIDSKVDDEYAKESRAFGEKEEK